MEKKSNNDRPQKQKLGMTEGVTPKLKAQSDVEDRLVRSPNDFGSRGGFRERKHARREQEKSTAQA